MKLDSSISKREKTLILLTLLAIFGSLLYSFVVEPLSRNYVQLQQEIQSKRIRLIKNTKLMRDKDIIEKEFEVYGQHLLTKGSNEEEMASVLSEIEKIGKSSGIYLSDVKPQKIRDMGYYKLLLVEIKFQASMQTLSKFIYDLRNSSLLLKVQRLQINIQGGESALLEGLIQISKISLI